MRKLIGVILVVLVRLPQSNLFGQEADETGLFLSLHGSALWSTSGTHGEFYGKKAHGAYGAGVGYRHSDNLTTFAYVAYHPLVKGTFSYTVTPLLPPYRQYVLQDESEIRMWLIYVGAEHRLFSVGSFSFMVDFGAVAGLSTEEKLNAYGDKASNTVGTAGLFAGPASIIRIAETPMTVTMAGHYRYAPSVNTVQDTDDSGVMLLLGLRFNI